MGVTPRTVFFGFTKIHLAGNVASSRLWAERGSPGAGDEWGRDLEVMSVLILDEGS